MLVRITPDLEELIGILIGDGCVMFYPHLRQYAINVNTNSLTDSQHLLKRVVPLMKKVWDVEPKIFTSKGENTIRCRFYSREIVVELLKLHPLIFWKTLTCRIPKFILKNKKRSINCLRGLFDTDGSIFSKYNEYAQIGFRSLSKGLRKDILTILKKLNFNPSVDKSQGYIFIHRQNEIIQFFNLVGSANPKHIVRYKFWITNKRVPKIKEITEKINNYKGQIPYFDTNGQLI